MFGKAKQIFIKHKVLSFLALSIFIIVGVYVFLLPSSPSEPFAEQRLELKENDCLNNVYFIFLNGLGSAYNDDVYVSMGFDRIRDSLSPLGYSFHDARFLLYSYAGGKVKDGQWHPKKYKVQDTGQPLHLSIEKLGALFEEFLLAHPEASFIFMGHSLGGRIALDFVSTTSPQNKEKIIGVITLNSPLLGAGRKVPNFIMAILGDFDNIFESPVVKELLWESQYQQELANLRRETIKELQNNGIRVATFSTYQDYFVNPLTACILDEKHQPISEGFIIDLGKPDFNDLIGHMVILENPEIIKYILSLCRLN
ncbi:MAG: lipase family protein [Peptococcia bacterium]